ncbi:MAG: Activator of Hsp90 ATPase 1 family protein [Devosia sp.]|uniref:SRPBCC domain-containing protein n=1 Tax=Devosia sp. TaxID=1871048 RepID=UPI00261F820F|nr:SRPBCC domain-containing protein [Devosia sp.]MDB5538560.1 Activator of Hsp90 ATPase 1 family protein [Devosia sp.]
MAQDSLEQRELVITRRLKAPRNLVWRTFEDPYLLAQWWGPENFTSAITRLEFRAGGEWHVTMQRPDGTEHPVRYQFVEIVVPERIVYRPLRSPEAVPRRNPPPTYLATLTFEALGNETVFTMRAEFESAADLAVAMNGGFLEGTNQAFDKLERQLASR